MKIIAIDGPAGSGKSTICSRLAGELAWSHINTGALYRAAAYAMDVNKLINASSVLRKEQLQFFTENLRWDHTHKRLYFQDEDISKKIYSTEIGQLSSKVAKIPELRTALLPIQREWALSTSVGALVEGRDVGTIVFPDADLKIFLTADIEDRASRRLLQLQKSGVNPLPSLNEVKAQIELRDQQDRLRGVAPLKQADDAIEFNTSQFPLDECISKLVNIIKQRV